MFGAAVTARYERQNIGICPVQLMKAKADLENLFEPLVIEIVMHVIWTLVSLPSDRYVIESCDSVHN